MPRIRMQLVTALVFLLVATQPTAGSVFGDVSQKLNKPSIWIINDASDVWEVKVWSYPSGTAIPILSCQTLGWSSERVREIEPLYVQDPLLQLSHDHCGNFDSLSLWFRVWNRNTGEYLDIDTVKLGMITPWGATWTWNGSWWSCDKC